jgi:hypothetical protein
MHAGWNLPTLFSKRVGEAFDLTIPKNCALQQQQSEIRVVFRESFVRFDPCRVTAANELNKTFNRGCFEKKALRQLDFMWCDELHFRSADTEPIGKGEIV